MRVLNSMKKAKRGKEKESLEGFVRKGCANFQGGACLGMDLNTRFCVPLPKCLVLVNLPCDYLERCVLPLAQKQDACSAIKALYAQRFPTDQERDFCLVDELAQDTGNGELHDRYRSHPFLDHRPSRVRQVKPLESGKEKSRAS